jgi:hypothetical protein
VLTVPSLVLVLCILWVDLRFGDDEGLMYELDKCFSDMAVGVREG